MPFLADRIAFLAKRFPVINGRLPNGPEHDLKRAYYDTGNVMNPSSFASLRTFAPVSQLLFASDYPQLPVEGSVHDLNALGLSPSDLAAIQRENALRIFPRLRSV
jgi:predicted TIM-barrel fold metal-dependent hydrolase